MSSPVYALFRSMLIETSAQRRLGRSAGVPGHPAAGSDPALLEGRLEDLKQVPSTVEMV
jgi:hypothetical protein